ncbi:MAG: bifunctional phosphoserine phosphatase/homoserine phosphotransferase ThrH [Candidatus Omnitrophica bacterium]|nr:bifunctional phosphoserine phosphatase/homoserine phosphotransferase ThrH [Candidatus Omnitrophota bacterium]
MKKPANSAIICCLDLEGVLIPEIWIKVSEKTGIKELRLTTRDEPNYDLLMKRRLAILREHKIKLRDIQKVISTIKPLPGANQFLNKLRSHAQVVILSDTYYEFAAPLLKQLGHPTLFCNWLETDRGGFIKNYHLRQRNGKEKSVRALKKLNFRVHAAGDSYNDVTMLQASHQGVLFNPPPSIRKEFPKFPVAMNYAELFKKLIQ